MADLTIWHNPRCSKSRQTLTLLEEADVEPTIRLYLDDPPTVAELDEALTALGLEPWEFARMGEARAKELGVKDLEHDRVAWIELMVANPILIERPVVLSDDGRAVLGRPPDNVTELVGG